MSGVEAMIRFVPKLYPLDSLCGDLLILITTVEADGLSAQRLLNVKAPALWHLTGRFFQSFIHKAVSVCGVPLNRGGASARYVLMNVFHHFAIFHYQYLITYFPNIFRTVCRNNDRQSFLPRHL